MDPAASDPLLRPSVADRLHRLVATLRLVPAERGTTNFGAIFTASTGPLSASTPDDPILRAAVLPSRPVRRLRRPVSSRAGIRRDNEGLSGHLLGCEEVGPRARRAGDGDSDVLL